MAEFRKWYYSILDSIDHIVTQRKAGKSAEEIVEDGLPSRFDRFAERPSFVKPKRWIQVVYDQTLP
jgi:hypothetical protein